MIVAMVAHIFFGAHASHLVLCIGKNGHVAVEAVHHPKHDMSISEHQHQEHIKSCQSEDCLDIELSFEHTELYDIQSKPAIELDTAFTYQSTNQFATYLFQPIKPSIVLVSNHPPPRRAITNTLKTTILLI